MTTTDAVTAGRAVEPLLAGLNREQRAAAEAVRGPVAILAGAGTGKTRTITHRIAHQVRSGTARASEILAVTFTERAAHELRERLRQLGLPRPVRAATFHAAAWAQLRHFWPQLDDGPVPEVLPSKLRLLVPVARRLRVEATDLAAEIEWAKARGLAPEAYAAQAARRDPPVPAERMVEVYDAYERDKAERNLIDYEDMLLRTTAALQANAEVAAGVHGRYRVFTVDEFQDVNPAQWALLDAWLGGRRELCVVGDDDQTIYRFTGASETYLTGFARRFPDATVITLTRNYRSSPQVLEVANRVLAGKPPELRKTLVATKPDGPTPRLEGFEHGDGEVDAVVDRVRELLDEDVPPGEIAILYRVNSQSEPFEAALGARRIPYLVRGDAGFFRRPEIRQALDALAAAARTPPPGPRRPPPVGGSAPARGPRPDREAERVLRDRLSWNPRREPAGERARERWRNLGALVELLTRLAEEDRDLDAIVTDLRARAAAGHDSPEEGRAVVLSTIHKAKGLEFDAVFVVSVEEGLLPISHARTDADHWDERRLFYVALTRARHHLWVSWATRRTGRRGRDVRRVPSRLLSGLGPGAPPASRPRRAQQPRAGPTAVDRELEARLREWRRERAQRDGVPAYVVFPDSTLWALAAAPPDGLEDLLAVPGFGPTRVDRYGEDVLAVLRPSSVRGDTRPRRRPARGG